MVGELPVVVIGAGPVGLAAAAHLAQRGLPFVVVEAGGEVAASVRQWAQVRLFTPWRWAIDTAARDLLGSSAWVAPDPEARPTGGELVDRYLAPLAAQPAIAPRLRLGAAVTAISREGFDRVRTAGREESPFVVRLADGDEIRARAVIDAAGTWRTPNPVGGNGLPAHGESQARAAGRVVDGMPDVLGGRRDEVAGRRVAVVGAGHSAMGTLLALAELPDTTIDWIVRAPAPAYGGGEDDALPARGSIGTRLRALVAAERITLHSGFVVRAIDSAGLLATDGRTVDADIVVNATGARADHGLAAELRLDLDPVLGSTRALAPLIDPNVHSCGTVPPHGVDQLAHPEAGYYVVGAKSYGRAPTFLLATGYEQARSVVAALDDDWAAAREVRLDLPATGVCSTGLTSSPSGGDACCAPTTTQLLGLPLVAAPRR